MWEEYMWLKKNELSAHAKKFANTIYEWPSHKKSPQTPPKKSSSKASTHYLGHAPYSWVNMNSQGV
jgi:hypothetical protein